MTKLEHLTQQIEELEFQRVDALEKELRLHAEYMKLPSGSEEERAKERELDELAANIDSLSDKIGVIAARLYLIEGAESRKRTLWDAASLYGRVL